MTRIGLRALLEGEGFRVVGESGVPEEIVQQLARRPPDLVIIEPGLEGGRGVGVLRALSRSRIAPRLVVVSAREHPRFIIQALRLGADAYVPKSCPAAEILQAVEAVAELGSRHRDH